MAVIEHVLTGAVAPASAPPSVGAHYVNTATGDIYIARGTASVSDWGSPLAAEDLLVYTGGGPLNVDGSARRVVWLIGSAPTDGRVVAQMPAEAFVAFEVAIVNQSAAPVDIDFVDGSGDGFVQLSSLNNHVNHNAGPGEAIGQPLAKVVGLPWVARDWFYLFLNGGE